MDVFRDIYLRPNPTDGTFTLELPDNLVLSASIQIIDSTGKIILTNNDCSASNIIDLSDYSA